MWQAKLKNRIESLERLLAEERQKVNMAEKKLHLSAEQGLAPSLSDDVKLRLREKELLQEEVSVLLHCLAANLVVWLADWLVVWLLTGYLAC